MINVGVPGKPGRVVTLVKSSTGSTTGVAYLVVGDQVKRAIDRVRPGFLGVIFQLLSAAFWRLKNLVLEVFRSTDSKFDEKKAKKFFGSCPILAFLSFFSL